MNETLYPFNLKNPYLCLHIRERVVNTSRPGEMQVTIQNLMPDTKYRFRVVAHNGNGQGESSAALKVATQAEGKDTQTIHLYVFSKRDTNIQFQLVCWENAHICTPRQTGCAQKKLSQFVNKHSHAAHFK